MGCCASGPTVESVKESMKEVVQLADESAGRLRGSFRHSGHRKPLLHANWEKDVHSVNSEYRQRRLSDQSLFIVVRDEKIADAFRRFLMEEGMEMLQAFWERLDQFEKKCQEYRKSVPQKRGSGGSSGKTLVNNNKSERSSKSSLPKADTADTVNSTWSSIVSATGASSRTFFPPESEQELLQEAQNIYWSFFKDGTSPILSSLLSRSVVQDLKTDLQVNEEGIMEQRNLDFIECAFKVLHLRVHNVLKYDYLPIFLVSEYFLQLGVEEIDDDEYPTDEAAPVPLDDIRPILGIGEDGEVDPDLLDQKTMSGGSSDAMTMSGGYSSRTIMLDEKAMENEASEFVEDAEKSPFFFEFIFMEAKSFGGGHSRSQSGGANDSQNRRDSIRDQLLRRRRSHTLLKQLDIVELYLEMEALLETTTSTTDEKARTKRFNRLLTRYGSPSQELLVPPVASLRDLYDKLNGEDPDNPGIPLEKLPETPIQELFQPIREEVLKRIGRRIIPAFKRSNTYRMMIQETTTQGSDSSKGVISPESAPAPLLMAPPNAKNKVTKKDREDGSMSQKSMKSSSTSTGSEVTTVVELTNDTAANFATLQHVAQGMPQAPQFLTSVSKSISGHIPLDEVLTSSYGILQLKRFARKQFQEENVLFLVDTTQYQQNVRRSTWEDMYELLRRAESLCDQYIEVGAPLEVNISSQQRQQTLKNFAECSALFYESIKPGSGRGYNRLSTGMTTNPNHQHNVSTAQNDEILVKAAKIFEIATKEVTAMVSKGLWEDFRETQLFDDFVRKRGMKIAHSPRNSISNDK